MKNRSILPIALLAAILLVTTIVVVIVFVSRNKAGDEPGESLPLIVETEPQPSETYDLITTLSQTPITNYEDARSVITQYAEANGKTLADYPTVLVDLLAREPDALRFVLEYPFREAAAGEIDLSGETNMLEVPSFVQWDQRWGYKPYGTGIMGTTGSGPTCLSMAAVYLLKNTDMTPAWIADYGINNGYVDDTTDNGAWCSLMTDGAYNLGIDVVQITVEEDRIKRNLDVGNIALCQSNIGASGNEGHYFLITGYDETGFIVVDPYLPSNSSRTWTITELENTVQRIWVYRIL